jgi:hypothetical protein
VDPLKYILNCGGEGQYINLEPIGQSGRGVGRFGARAATICRVAEWVNIILDMYVGQIFEFVKFRLFKKKYLWGGLIPPSQTSLPLLIPLASEVA